MTIERLVVSYWGKAPIPTRIVGNPTWQQVESAIRALDAADYNDIMMIPVVANEGTWLAVGGGAGRYVVTGSIEHNRFPTVVREPGIGLKRHEEENEMVMVGGQEGDYPRRWIVDLETAMRAARAFHLTGEFGGGRILWEDV